MFRLMKLMAYALFGYALYEFFRGMTAEGGGMGGGQGRMGGSMGRAMDMGREMMGGGGHGQISGPAEGRGESTLESDGGSVTHRVGRGVIPSGM